VEVSLVKSRIDRNIFVACHLAFARFRDEIAGIHFYSPDPFAFHHLPLEILSRRNFGAILLN
jgi:hypothetical protein